MLTIHGLKKIGCGALPIHKRFLNTGLMKDEITVELAIL